MQAMVADCRNIAIVNAYQSIKSINLSLDNIPLYNIKVLYCIAIQHIVIIVHCNKRVSPLKLTGGVAEGNLEV